MKFLTSTYAKVNPPLRLKQGSVRPLAQHHRLARLNGPGKVILRISVQFCLEQFGRDGPGKAGLRKKVL